MDENRVIIIYKRDMLNVNEGETAGGYSLTLSSSYKAKNTDFYSIFVKEVAVIIERSFSRGQKIELSQCHSHIYCLIISSQLPMSIFFFNECISSMQNIFNSLVCLICLLFFSPLLTKHSYAPSFPVEVEENGLYWSHSGFPRFLLQNTKACPFILNVCSMEKC